MIPLIINLVFSKRPIVMVPPMYASNMWVTIENLTVQNDTTISIKDKLLWVNKTFFEKPFDVFGLKSMKIIWKNDTIENANGYFNTKDFGGDESTKKVESIQNFKSHFAVTLNESIHFFKDRGYQIHKDLYIAPYDWRIAPTYTTEFWPRFKHLVETAFRSNKRQRVVLFGYDLGGFMIQQFLGEKVTKEWKEKYIEKSILLAPTFAGRGPNFQEMWEQYSPMAPWLTSSELSEVVETWPSVHAQNLNHVVFKDTPIAIAMDGAEAKPYHAHSLLRASGRSRPSTVGIYNRSLEILRRAPAPPGVETDIIYNSAIPTVQTLRFNNGFEQRPEALRGRGDGEVLAEAMEWACAHWAATTCTDLRRPRASFMHRRLIANEEVLDIIYAATQAPSTVHDIRDEAPEIVEVDERSVKDNFSVWRYFNATNSDTFPGSVEVNMTESDNEIDNDNENEIEGEAEGAGHEDVVYDNDEGDFFKSPDVVISSEEANATKEDSGDDYENAVDGDDYTEKEYDEESDEVNIDEEEESAVVKDDEDEDEEEEKIKEKEGEEKDTKKDKGMFSGWGFFGARNKQKDDSPTPSPTPAASSTPNEKSKEEKKDKSKTKKSHTSSNDEEEEEKETEKEKENEKKEEEEVIEEDDEDEDFGSYFIGRNKEVRKKETSKNHTKVEVEKIPVKQNTTRKASNTTGQVWHTPGEKLGIGEQGVLRKRVRVNGTRVHRRRVDREQNTITQEDDENAIEEDEDTQRIKAVMATQKNFDEVVVEYPNDSGDGKVDKEKPKKTKKSEQYEEDDDENEIEDENENESETETEKQKKEEEDGKEDQEVEVPADYYDDDEDSEDAEDNKIRNAKKKEDEEGDRPSPGQILDLEDDDEEEVDVSTKEVHHKVTEKREEEEEEKNEKENVSYINNVDEYAEYTSEYEYEYVYETDDTAVVFDDAIYWSEANPPGPIPEIKDEFEVTSHDYSDNDEDMDNENDVEPEDDFDEFDNDFEQDQDL